MFISKDEKKNIYELISGLRRYIDNNEAIMHDNLSKIMRRLSALESKVKPIKKSQPTDAKKAVTTQRKTRTKNES